MQWRVRALDHKNRVLDEFVTSNKEEAYDIYEGYVEVMFEDIDLHGHGANDIAAVSCCPVEPEPVATTEFSLN